MNSKAFIAAMAALAFAISGQTMAQEPRTLRVAYVQKTDHPHGLGIQRFADLVQQKSGGRLRSRPSATRRWGVTCRCSRRCKAAR